MQNEGPQSVLQGENPSASRPERLTVGSAEPFRYAGISFVCFHTLKDGAMARRPRRGEASMGPSHQEPPGRTTANALTQSANYPKRIATPSELRCYDEGTERGDASGRRSPAVQGCSSCTGQGVQDDADLSTPVRLCCGGVAGLIAQVGTSPGEGTGSVLAFQTVKWQVICPLTSLRTIKWTLGPEHRFGHLVPKLRFGH